MPLPPWHHTRLPVDRSAPRLRGRPAAATSLCDDLGTLLAVVARNVLQSVTVPLPLPHQLSGTACRRTCGHPHRCSCSGVGSSLSFSGAPLGTPRDYCQTVTRPCSFSLYVKLSIIRLLRTLSSHSYIAFYGRPPASWPTAIISYC